MISFSSQARFFPKEFEQCILMPLVNMPHLDPEVLSNVCFLDESKCAMFIDLHLFRFLIQLSIFEMKKCGSETRGTTVLFTLSL